MVLADTHQGPAKAFRLGGVAKRFKKDQLNKLTCQSRHAKLIFRMD